MYATDFEYAGERLSDYGMTICSFNGNGDIETLSSGSDITFNQVKAGKSNTFQICSSNYEIGLVSTFQICKNPCLSKNQDEMMLTTLEVSILQKWLCRKNQYHRFKILNKDGYEDLYWNATFTAKQITLCDKIIGLELTLYTDAPFTYMDKICIERDCSEIHSFDIYDVSDEEGWIYPDIKITLLESGDFRLSNSLDDKDMLLKECIENEVISINGKSHIISTSDSRSIANQFNYCFPRIINSYDTNKNTFTCSLKCKIEFSYSPIKKIGL